MLLQYLKNEFTQKEILKSLEDYVDNSISFEDAEESVNHLHQIVLDIEEKVELQEPQESMQRIPLFEPDEELGKYLPLGLNTEYDQDITFSPRDLILVGGRRGAGKSITCANIANSVYASGKSALYFTIEMDSRAILQRCCSIATGIPFSRLRTKNLSIPEWEQVAGWWAARYSDSQERLTEYREHRDFEKFHDKLKTSCELLPTQQLDVIYDPLTEGLIEGTVHPKRAHTMIGLKRLDNIQQCFENVLKDNIEGDLIETGVWRGGATIFMSGLIKSYLQKRKVFVCDSFNGLPKPDVEKYPDDSGDQHWTYKDLNVSIEEVYNNFKSYDLLTDNVVFVEGWFDQTLPLLKGEVFSIIRLDGDMYGSTWAALENLYPKLSIGGYLIVDDWLLEGANKSVLDYRKMYNIDDELEFINDHSVFWRKTK